MLAILILILAAVFFGFPGFLICLLLLAVISEEC